MLVKNIKEWHKKVCERDDYVCQFCKTNFNYDCYFDLETGLNQYVCGHHLIRRRVDPKLILETDNGKCTCKECHTKIHMGK